MDIIHTHFSSLPSTNDWCKQQLCSFPREALSLISTDTQTAGRGRYGRHWLSPNEQNIYASFCFFIHESQNDPLSLTHLLALSIVPCLKNLGISCTIKWPNDLMVNGKKIAGILCETEHLTPYFGVVLGIGLNVNMSHNSLIQAGQPATSVREILQKECSPKELLAEIANQFLANLSHFVEKGFDPFFPSLSELMIESETNP